MVSPLICDFASKSLGVFNRFLVLHISANKEARFLAFLLITNVFHCGLLYLVLSEEAQFNKTSGWLMGARFQRPQLNTGGWAKVYQTQNVFLKLTWVGGELSLLARSNRDLSAPSRTPSTGRSQHPECVDENYTPLKKLFVLDTSEFFRILTLSVRHFLSFTSSAATQSALWPLLHLKSSHFKECCSLNP